MRAHIPAGDAVLDIGVGTGRLLGFTNVAAEGGVARRAPLLVAHGARLLPSLGLAAALASLGADMEQVELVPGGLAVNAPSGRIQLALDAAHRLRLDVPAGATRIGGERLVEVRERGHTSRRSFGKILFGFNDVELTYRP